MDDLQATVDKVPNAIDMVDASGGDPETLKEKSQGLIDDIRQKAADVERDIQDDIRDCSDEYKKDLEALSGITKESCTQGVNRVKESHEVALENIEPENIENYGVNNLLPVIPAGFLSTI
jgi:gas vesicle protein